MVSGNVCLANDQSRLLWRRKQSVFTTVSLHDNSSMHISMQCNKLRVSGTRLQYGRVIKVSWFQDGLFEEIRC